MGRKVNVIGVGMVKFQKPGASDDYNVMASKAIRSAIEDAKVDFADIESAYAGYVYGDSTCGQRAVYEVGLTGIPVVNVNNNCSTGSTALMLAKQMVEGGIAECVLAVGFEQMEKGALQAKWNDRTNPLDRHANVMNEVQGVNGAPGAAQMFGGAGREYRWKYGTKRETFAKVAEKARKHAAKNPLALFQETYSVDEILASPEVFDPLTRYQCCPPTCGAAAAILCSDDRSVSMSSRRSRACTSLDRCPASAITYLRISRRESANSGCPASCVASARTCGSSAGVTSGFVGVLTLRSIEKFLFRAGANASIRT